MTHHSICFYVYCCFKMISLLCTGRSDRVTRSIKSLVFKSRQSWKILVKLRVLLFQKIFVIRQFHYRWRRVSVSSGNWVHPGEFASSGIIIIFSFLHCSLSSVTGFIHFSRWFSMEKKKKWNLSLFVSGFFQLLANCYYYFRILIGCTPHAKKKKNILFFLFISLSIWLFAVLLSLWETHHTSHTHMYLKKKNLNDIQKIPSRNWKITLRMWMLEGRKVKRSCFFSFFTSFSYRIFMIFARHFSNAVYTYFVIFCNLLIFLVIFLF